MQNLQKLLCTTSTCTFDAALTDPPVSFPKQSMLLWPIQWLLTVNDVVALPSPSHSMTHHPSPPPLLLLLLLLQHSVTWLHTCHHIWLKSDSNNECMQNNIYTPDKERGHQGPLPWWQQSAAWSARTRTTKMTTRQGWQWPVNRQWQWQWHIISLSCPSSFLPPYVFAFHVIGILPLTQVCPVFACIACINHTSIIIITIVWISW